MRPGAKLKVGKTVSIGEGRMTATIVGESEGGARIVDFECEGTFEAALDELGEMPLPPYIHEKLADRSRYQTVYAKEDGAPPPRPRPVCTSRPSCSTASARREST